MKLGYASMNNPTDLRPDVLARALEDRGFESLWIGEHSHIPVSRETAYRGGSELPELYLAMMDPFISLAIAAEATTTLKVATGVCLALEHDIFQLAKQVATLDRLSGGGRFLFGVGVGWNVEELANHRPDIPWKRRYRALEECVAALRTLWTKSEPEFHGEYYDFDPVWSNPKPATEPSPPVMFGAAGPVGHAHAIRWADEWTPIDARLGDVAGRIEQFRAAAAEAGRPDIPVTVHAFGDPTLDQLLRYRDLGVHRVVVGSVREHWADPSTTLGFLDRYADMVPRLAD